MTAYTFSVVATNSIGSGEAGVVMITTPGENMIQSYNIKSNLCTLLYFFVIYSFIWIYCNIISIRQSFIFCIVSFRL